MDANIKSNPPHPQMESPNMLKKKTTTKRKSRENSLSGTKRTFPFAEVLKRRTALLWYPLHWRADSCASCGLMPPPKKNYKTTAATWKNLHPFNVAAPAFKQEINFLRQNDDEYNLPSPRAPHSDEEYKRGTLKDVIGFAINNKLVSQRYPLPIWGRCMLLLSIFWTVSVRSSSLWGIIQFITTWALHINSVNNTTDCTWSGITAFS